MYIYIYTLGIHACLPTYIHLHAYNIYNVCIDTYIYTDSWMCVHVFIHICIHTYKQIFMHVCLHIYIDIYMCISMHTPLPFRLHTNMLPFGKNIHIWQTCHTCVMYIHICMWWLWCVIHLLWTNVCVIRVFGGSKFRDAIIKKFWEGKWQFSDIFGSI